MGSLLSFLGSPPAQGIPSEEIPPNLGLGGPRILPPGVQGVGAEVGGFTVAVVAAGLLKSPKLRDLPLSPGRGPTVESSEPLSVSDMMKDTQQAKRTTGMSEGLHTYCTTEIRSSTLLPLPLLSCSFLLLFKILLLFLVPPLAAGIQSKKNARASSV